MSTQPTITLESLKGDAHSDVGKLVIVLDGENIGDTDDNVGVISPERRRQQANLYRRDLFDGNTIPPAIYRYLHFFFLEESMNEPKYDSIAQVEKWYENIKNSDEHTEVLNIIKYSVINEEAAQVLGFVLIFTAMLNLMVKRKMTLKLIIENPLHEIESVGKLFSMIELMVNDIVKIKNSES